MLSNSLICCWQGVDLDFVGLDTLCNLKEKLPLSKKNTKLLGLLVGPWKSPRQVRNYEEVLFASWYHSEKSEPVELLPIKMYYTHLQNFAYNFRGSKFP